MKPTPYSTLRDGRIVWVYPEPAGKSKKKLRSRPETDDEVRKRLLKAGLWHYPMSSSKELDAQLEYWKLPPRGFVDEAE